MCLYLKASVESRLLLFVCVAQPSALEGPLVLAFWQGMTIDGINMQWV